MSQTPIETFPSIIQQSHNYKQYSPEVPTKKVFQNIFWSAVEKCSMKPVVNAIVLYYTCTYCIVA